MPRPDWEARAIERAERAALRRELATLAMYVAIGLGSAAWLLSASGAFDGLFRSVLVAESWETP